MLNIVKFSVDLVTGISRARNSDSTGLRIRTTALNHEVRDDTVELGSVIEPLTSKLLKICNVIWSFVFKESKDNLAPVGLDDGDFFADLRCGHGYRVPGKSIQMPGTKGASL